MLTTDLYQYVQDFGPLLQEDQTLGEIESFVLLLEDAEEVSLRNMMSSCSCSQLNNVQTCNMLGALQVRVTVV